jgi:hypothetical protein
VAEATPHTPNEPGREANPEKSNGPEQSSADANLDRPGVQAEELARSKPHRSNEFWLALAGIGATLIVGVSGSWIAYQSSADKIRADAMRAAIDQRKTAYVDYLTAEARLWHSARGLSTKFSQLAHHWVDDKSKVGEWDEWNNYRSTVDEALPVDRTVRLMASTRVTTIVNDWDNHDNKVQELITDIKDAVDNKPLHTVPEDRLAELKQEAEIWPRSNIQKFVDAAQCDLDLSKC